MSDDTPVSDPEPVRYGLRSLDTGAVVSIVGDASQPADVPDGWERVDYAEAVQAQAAAQIESAADYALARTALEQAAEYAQTVARDDQRAAIEQIAQQVGVDFATLARALGQSHVVDAQDRPAPATPTTPGRP